MGDTHVLSKLAKFRGDPSTYAEMRAKIGGRRRIFHISFCLGARSATVYLPIDAAGEIFRRLGKYLTAESEAIKSCHIGIT